MQREELNPPTVLSYFSGRADELSSKQKRRESGLTWIVVMGTGVLRSKSSMMTFMKEKASWAAATRRSIAREREREGKLDPSRGRRGQLDLDQRPGRSLKRE